MLRTFAILLFIGNALAHVVSFALSWASVQQVFTPPPGLAQAEGDWFSSPDRIIKLLWLLIVSGVMIFAIMGLLGSGVGLAYNRPWWRQWAIVTALTSLVALLPWLALLSPLSAVLLITIDSAIVLALALPWGDSLVHRVQHK
jgi:hypothetical protein